MTDLQGIAARLTAPGKGLLASDESTGTIGKRLEKAGIENTAEQRRAYRELFYTASIGNSISGAILFEETLYQSTSHGQPFVEALTSQGVLPGIKVDKGLVPLDGCPNETSTRGLDGLADQCKEYHRQGARFAKWRAALRIGPGCPSEQAVNINACQLAQYAAVCQHVGLVPIVEPEILIDGPHGVEQFAQASQQNVLLEGALLKPQMMIAGTQYTGPKPTPQEIAQQTLAVMRRCVPAAMPGIMFLSGGQSEEEATVNLNALNVLAQQGLGPGRSAAPWALSFSYGRALQASVLKLWSQDRANNKEKAKAMAAALAAANGAATLGQYKGPHPSITTADGSLAETFRGWRTDI